MLADTQEKNYQEIVNLKGFVECEAPNEFLETFDAAIHFSQEEGDYFPNSLRFLLQNCKKRLLQRKF